MKGEGVKGESKRERQGWRASVESTLALRGVLSGFWVQGLRACGQELRKAEWFVGQGVNKPSLRIHGLASGFRIEL